MTDQPAAGDPAALLAEFLRVLALLDVVVGREEYVVSVQGVMLLRDHAAQRMAGHDLRPARSQRSGKDHAGPTAGSYVATFPSSGQPALNGEPYGITKAADGDVYFTEMGAGGFGRLDPASGTITQYQPPSISGSDQSWSIVAGPDGNLWFTYGAGSPKAGVGCLTPAGASAQYPAPSPGSNPDGVAVGTDGAIWFAELTNGKIARLYPVACGAGGHPVGPPPPRPPARVCSAARLRLSSVRILGAAGHIVWDLAVRVATGRFAPAREPLQPLAIPAGSGAPPAGGGEPARLGASQTRPSPPPRARPLARQALVG